MCIRDSPNIDDSKCFWIDFKLDIIYELEKKKLSSIFMGIIISEMMATTYEEEEAASFTGEIIPSAELTRIIV